MIFKKNNFLKLLGKKEQLGGCLKSLKIKDIFCICVNLFSCFFTKTFFLLYLL